MRYLLLILLLTGCAADYPSGLFVYKKPKHPEALLNCGDKAIALCMSYNRKTHKKVGVACDYGHHGQAFTYADDGETRLPLILWVNGTIAVGEWDKCFTPTCFYSLVDFQKIWNGQWGVK